jgi:hypothetical protein
MEEMKFTVAERVLPVAHEKEKHLELMKFRLARMVALWLFFIITVFPCKGFAADAPRTADNFFEQAISLKPTVHDVGERLRIARGINPDGIAVYAGVHEALSYPGDTEPDDDDFREEAYGQLRSELRMTYAELASCRGQIEELKRGSGLLRNMVATAHTLYANGRVDQLQAVKAQIEWEKAADALQLQEKREKILSIRLNVLAGIGGVEPVPPLQPLGEYAPSFDTEEVVAAYKSRRFLELFQKMITPDKPATGEGLHEGDSLDTESAALVASARITLENLNTRARRYRSSLIPQLELAHAARLEQYKNGKLDFSMLLDGLVMLSDMRREYQMLLGEVHMLRAKLEYVTGLNLE